MSKFQDTIRDAQSKFTGRARAFEADARKFAETLQGRAEAELKGLLKIARESSREQAFAIGVELEKLGKKIQERASAPAGETAPTEEVKQ